MTTKPLDALRESNFRWFFCSGVTTALGSSMTPVALAFAVLHLDNSAGALSHVLATYMAAQVCFVILGGLAADRFRRTLVLQGSYLLGALSQGTVAVLLLSERASLTSLIVLEAVNGAAAAFALPAVQGVVPQLVARTQLQQANAAMSFARRGAMILGPAIAGALVATVGPGWAIAADATGFALGALTLTRVRLPDAVRTGHESLLTELRAGWSEVRSRTWLWVIIVAFGVVNVIHAGAWSVLGPVIAKSHPELGARGWGLVVSAEGVGAIAMTLVLLRLPLRRPLRQGMICVSLMAVPLCTLGIRPETLLVGIGALIAGAGTEVFGTGWNVALMEQVPQEALSRVSSWDMLGSFLAIPAGTLAYGWLATHVDLERLLVVSGILYAVAALGTLLVPSVRGLCRAPGLAPAPSPPTPVPDVPGS